MLWGAKWTCLGACLFAPYGRSSGGQASIGRFALVTHLCPGRFCRVVFCVFFSLLMSARRLSSFYLLESDNKTPRKTDIVYLLCMTSYYSISTRTSTSDKPTTTTNHASSANISHVGNKIIVDPAAVMLMKSCLIIAEQKR